MVFFEGRHIITIRVFFNHPNLIWGSMTFRRHCKTFDSVWSRMKNLKIAIANNSIGATAMSKTHNNLTLFLVNLHFVREWIDFLMAKCENLEFFRGARVLKYPTPCQMSFEHIVGRFWVGPAHLWNKCRLWESPAHPSTLEKARAGPHNSFSLHSKARQFILLHSWVV